MLCFVVVDQQQIQCIYSKFHLFHTSRFDNWHVPLLYIFMTDKSEETYRQIFRTLKQLQPLLNPTDFTVDFEMAAINAIKSEFAMAEIHCCKFHFGQNVFRNVQRVGLQSIYQSDPEFAFQIRRHSFRLPM